MVARPSPHHGKEDSGGEGTGNWGCLLQSPAGERSLGLPSRLLDPEATFIITSSNLGLNTVALLFPLGM